MRPDDFFIPRDDAHWDLKGVDPWNRVQEVFDVDYIDEVRRGKAQNHSDLEIAQALSRLVYDDLRSFGTDGNQRLSNDDMHRALHCLRVVLSRLGVQFELPFRDSYTFKDYWIAQGMSGSWGARREYLLGVFEPVFAKLDNLEERELTSSYRGVDGQLKNIIFASTGSKPEIVFQNALDNVIQVTKNAEHCLFYDRPLSEAGLTWAELVDWWRDQSRPHELTEQDVARNLYARLLQSTGSKPERVLFRAYCERYGREDGGSQPALLPQVYLHFDPKTRWERGGSDGVLKRERMDFLLLLPNGVRIVLEVDGKQHYAEGNTASPRLYSEMVAEDRKLRLKGYEVYRFGGYELMQSGSTVILQAFFEALLGP